MAGEIDEHAVVGPDLGRKRLGEEPTEPRQGGTSVDVQSVDGKQIREPGKPPWAGGPMVVGKDHPGWSQDKADRAAAKAADMKSKFGLDCWPPGHCKDASGKPQTPNPTATPTP